MKKTLNSSKHLVLIGYQKYWEGMVSVRRILEMYEGYQKLKKNTLKRANHWVLIGYQKYAEGIRNIRRVSENKKKL